MRKLVVAVCGRSPGFALQQTGTPSQLFSQWLLRHSSSLTVAGAATVSALIGSSYTVFPIILIDRWRFENLKQVYLIPDYGFCKRWVSRHRLRNRLSELQFHIPWQEYPSILAHLSDIGINHRLA